MPERNPMLAVGDTITFKLDPGHNSVVAFQLPSTVEATSTVVCEVTIDEDNWLAAAINLYTGYVVDQITGPGAGGYTVAAGAKKCRLRATVLPSGSIPVETNQTTH